MNLLGSTVDRNRTKHKKEDKTQVIENISSFIEVTKVSLEIYVSQALSGVKNKERLRK